MIFEFPERLTTREKWLPYALLISVTFALYATTLYFDFVWDDFAYIGNNFRIHGLDWPHLRMFWTYTYLGHYAPVHHTVLAILYNLFGTEPFGYHLGQLLIHAACVGLLYLTLKKLESARIAFLATLLFAVHPTNVETVAWISETKSTVAFLFFLLSFLCFIRQRERGGWVYGIAAGMFLILSVLAKINTVVAPVIFLAYDYREGATLRNLKWRSLGAFFLISGLFTLVHLYAFHGTSTELESEYLGGVAVHIMNMPLLISFYLKMIVYPHPLSAWEMFPAQFQFNWLIALGWVGLAALVWLLTQTSRTIQFWAIWIFIFLLPVLQIVPFPVWVADRYLYIPAIGAFVIFSQAYFRVIDGMASKFRFGLEFALISIVLLLAWNTKRQIPIWKNDLALWSATTPTCLGSPYCHMNLGLALLQSGQREQGVREMIRAAELRQGPLEFERLGDAYTLATHDYRQAIIAYMMVTKIAGNSAISVVYGKLARVLYFAGNLDDARKAVETGKKVNPIDPGLWIMDSVLLWKQGDWDASRKSLRYALAMTGRRSNTAGFIADFFGRPGEVGQMLSDLRSDRPGPMK